MTRVKKGQRLRVEFEFNTHAKNRRIEQELKYEFGELLRKLTESGVINLRDYGASMTFVETTPFAWEI